MLWPKMTTLRRNKNIKWQRKNSETLQVTGQVKTKQCHTVAKRSFGRQLEEPEVELPSLVAYSFLLLSLPQPRGGELSCVSPPGAYG